MKDFTLSIYESMLSVLQLNKFEFLTVGEYFNIPRPIQKNLLILLRHDVDRAPDNALRMAKLENELGVKSTYYFRIKQQTFVPEVIKGIVNLGHEIGYHYECLSDTNGNYEEAIEDFKINLKKLRAFYPIKNIAMHGRPTSKWDSRLLWNRYDYKSFKIISEPYFDIDFNQMLYITDAGRSWDNERINLRDKVETKYKNHFKRIDDIISAIEAGQIPNKIMFNIHPEHWASSSLEWYKILILRKIKNSAKSLILRTTN